MQTIEDKFYHFLSNKDNGLLISFLKNLTDADKNILVPLIKKIGKTHEVTVIGNNFSLEHQIKDNAFGFIPMSQDSGRILYQFAFVCLDFKTLWRLFPFMPLEYIEKDILSWYEPTWIKQFMNAIAELEIREYTQIIDYMNKGWFVPTKQFIAQNAVYGLKDKLTYPISKEHIWYLFEEDTNLYCYDDWIKRFKHYAHQGDINRGKLLKESLLTSIRNFNKPQTGWFLKLFNALEPTEKELLSLQDELFLALGSPQSKAVGDALKYLKQISKHPDFKLNDFIEQIPVLLTWSIKSLITSTLSTIDILIKIYPEEKEKLGLLIVQSLAQEDENLQTKTIKLLSKHKLLETPSIINEIAIYTEGLYHSTKQLLPDIEEQSIEETIEITPPQRIREENLIIYPDSFDDMLFFFSGVLMNEEPHAVDVFLATLPKFDRLITNENIAKLEPIFHNAFNSCYPTNFTQTFKGRVGRIFAYYLAKYGLHLANKLPNAKYIEAMYNTARNAKSTNEFLMQDTSPLEKLKNDTQSDEFSIIYHLMDVMLKKIESENTLSFLSEPTHFPAYIDIETINNRIKEYNKLNIPIDTIDLQISKERSIGWVSIDILDNLSFDVVQKVYKKDKWKELSQENSKVISSLRITSDSNQKNTAGMYQYFGIKNLYIMSKVDIERLMILVPSNTHLLLRSVIQTALRYSTFSEQRIINFSASESGNKELVQDTLNILIQLWDSQHSTTYLFVATSMLYYDKTSRQLTSELWYKATLEGTMNHQLIGETLGKLEYNEYAPLKRFTDLVVSNMLNLSTLHNQGLHTLLSSMIANMNEESIKGTKKLLEIYLEVLSLTEIDIPSETMGKLEAWGEVKSLKSVMKKIM